MRPVDFVRRSYLFARSSGVLRAAVAVAMMHLPVRCNTCITFYHITRTPHRRSVVSAFFTLHFVNRPMLGLFSRIKSTVKSIQACRGRWKSFEDWGRRPWVGSSMAAAEFPCHRLRGFRHGALALLELGARLGCWSYRTAYVLRPAS